MVTAEHKASALQSRLEQQFSALQQRVGSHAEIAANLAVQLAALSQEAERLSAELLANFITTEVDEAEREVALLDAVDDGFSSELRHLIGTEEGAAGNEATIMAVIAKGTEADIKVNAKEIRTTAAMGTKETIRPGWLNDMEVEKVQDKTNDEKLTQTSNDVSFDGDSTGDLSDQKTLDFSHQTTPRKTTPTSEVFLPGEVHETIPEDDPSPLRVAAKAGEEDDDVSTPEEECRGYSKLSTWTSGLFPDPEDLKAKIRENLSKPQYDVKNLYHEHGLFQQIARSRVFEAVSLLVVSLNSLWISIDLDLNDANSLSDADAIFQVAAHAFCFFFCAELLVRFLAFKHKKDAATDFWFVFDFLMVLAIVLDTWIMTAIVAIVSAGGAGSSAGNTRILVVFRTFRLLRVARLVRVMRTIPEVMVILRGIGIALRAILVVLVLIGFIIYIAAIVLRVVLEDTAIGANRCNSIPSCMGVLLLDGTLSGSKGVPIMYEANDESFFYSVLIFGFVLIANITCMGVLTGLLVQTVKTVAECEHEEKAMKHMQKALNHVWDLINEHDKNGDGMISQEELRCMLADKRHYKLLHNLDVNLEGLVSVAGFALEHAGGELCKSKFKQMILDLRNKNVAKVKDVVETRKFIHEEFKKAGLIAPLTSETPKTRFSDRSTGSSSVILK